MATIDCFCITGNDIAYHVQYFGPQTKRGWVSSSLCQVFKGFTKFERAMWRNIKTCSPFKMSKVWRSYAVPLDQKQQLNQAIAEAEAANKLERNFRIHLLTYRYYSVRYARFYD